MTKNQYRMLVIGSFLLGIFAVVFDYIVNTLPAELQSLNLSLIRDVSDFHAMLSAVVGIFSLLFLLISLYGLLRFRQWAPPLNWIVGIVSLLLLVIDGAPMLKSAYAYALVILSSYLSVTVAILPYVNPAVKAMFFSSDE